MLAQQAEAYKKQHEEMYKRLSAPDRIMTVCEICGVFIASIDTDPKRTVGVGWRDEQCPVDAVWAYFHTLTANS